MNRSQRQERNHFMDKGLNTEEVSAVRNFGLERIRLRGVEMKQKGDWYAA